jgi:hypothetical protein
VNKKKQKNLPSSGGPGPSRAPLPQGGQKFFGSFFQKRAASFLLVM